MPQPFRAGDPVRLIRDPEAKGYVTHVYKRGIIRVCFDDGSAELCQPEELEFN